MPPAIRHASVEERDFEDFFDGIKGTFVLLDDRSDHVIVHNPERARTGFRPASTFKIASTLIALETGTATGPDFAMPWDSTTAPRQPWWPRAWADDHTLSTALASSVVWFYQEIVRRVGTQQMTRYLNRFAYGNADISGGIDRFWLSGGLRISAEEQVDFLRRFHVQALGLSERTTSITRELLVLEETPTYRLSGKTGWVGLGDESAPQIGWLVGYLERDSGVFFFALNIDIETAGAVAARLAITRAILGDLGLIGP